MPGQQCPEMHTDPYHTQTHTQALLSHQQPPQTSLWRHPAVPFISARHHGSDVCSLGVTPFLSFLPISLANRCKRHEVHLTLFNIKFYFEARVSLQSLLCLTYHALRWSPCSHLPLQSLGGGLWMAMPWIYTGDLTIIHPRSLQIGSLLKVNCTS